jgi:serine/threonine-protein kinase
MSPEGLSGEEMTQLSDQYSLGVVLYECATGRSPFAAANLPELVRTITGGKFTPLAEHNPRISARLISIIERAMSLVPHERYADMRELGRDLLQLAEPRAQVTYGLMFGAEPPGRDAASTQEGMAGLPSIAPLSASVPPPASEPNPFRPRSPARRFAFGAVMLSLVAVGVSWLKMESSTRPANTTLQAAGSSAPLEPAPLRVEESTPVEPSPAASTGAAASDGQREPQVVPVSLPSERQAPARRRVIVASVPRRATAQSGDTSPQWALPATAVVAVKSKGVAGPTPGTNGAPILD